MAQKQLPRRDERFALHKAIPAEVTITDGNEVRVAKGQAVDISLRGAKLELDDALSEHKAIQIELKPNEFDTTISATGTTCWVRPNDQEGWWLGVSFEENIQDSMIDKLAACGYVDRRQDSRSSTDLNICVRCELADAPISVKLRDLSVGGLGGWSPRPLEAESRLLIATDESNLDARPIVARVKWVRPCEDGYSFGCSFVSKEGYPELRRQVALHGDRKWRPRRETVRYMLGLVACLATLLFSYAWLSRV